MDKRALQSFSAWAKDNLENQIEVSLRALGVNSETDIKDARRVGDITVIDGDPNSYAADLFGKRDSIVKLVQRNGYRNVVEEFAYTWFNRFVALRFMEVHGFLSHGFRVLSNPAGGVEPEIMKNISLIKDDLHLDANLCADLKQQGKIEELFRYILICQCKALSDILPMLFSNDMGYLELLLPRTLLKGETVITKLIDIPEDAFLEDVEVIGWLYQFYVADKRRQYRNAKIVTKELIPTLTQVFTTDWIVRYLADNSIGRLWLEGHPDSSIRAEMEYYVDTVGKTEKDNRQNDSIKYKNYNPEEIRVIEPCCGSGHILVYSFDLLYKMYEECGYQKKDIPTLILRNNLVGLDIDKRAAQIASFSLVMKARSLNSRFFSKTYYVFPRVFEILDSNILSELGYHKQLKELNLLTDEEIDCIDQLVDTFTHAKTVGALLKVRADSIDSIGASIQKVSSSAIPNLFNAEFLNTGLERLRYLLSLAKLMTAKYDVMITNPPYLGISKFNDQAKEYLSYYYPDSKADMSAMFMEMDCVKHNGFRAIVNPDSWMFLSSFGQLRKKMKDICSIVTMAHLGLGAFDATVSTTAFVLRNSPIQLNGTFFRLVKSKNKQKDYFLVSPIIANPNDFDRIPGRPISYWVNEKIYQTFETGKAFPGETKKGVLTGDNEKYLRLWHEVSQNKIGSNIHSHAEMVASRYKWFFVTSGGDMRKWYGNIDTVVNLENDGYEIRKNVKNYRLRDKKFYFLDSITWTEVCSSTFSSRIVPQGVLFGNGGPVSFFPDGKLKYCLGLINSNVVMSMMSFLAPTLNYGPEQISKVPFLLEQEREIEAIVDECVAISKQDWDSFEISWDFKEHPFVRWSKELWDATAIGATMHYYYGNQPIVSSTLELCFMLWQGECRERFNRLKKNEEELNKQFINIYGLENELSPEEDEKEVTVRLADKERDVKSFISYLVGIVMGRYSLSTQGLTYAGDVWDEAKYSSFQPDDDGIIPVYIGVGMEDGLTTVLIRLIKQIFGEESYRGNIDFIAEALGKNGNESSEETLNRYLNDGFYADHLKMYQKRPIYWLFSSGKKEGFKCLVYMHRYNEDTLARINAKYFLPETTRKKNELEELSAKAKVAEGREGIRLEKARQSLAAAYNEAIEYGQVLDHMANQYIKIDLDDGVKVNYAKFQGIEIVTDAGSKVKKDLLAPIG